MEKKYKKLFLLVILLAFLVPTHQAIGQEVCTECEECEESEETGGEESEEGEIGEFEDEEFSIEIGGEEGEMTFDEGSMIGESAAEELGTNIAEEGVEITVEAETAMVEAEAMDASLPVLGVMITLVQIGWKVGWAIHDAVLAHRLKKEVRLAKHLFGGEYTAPIMPTYDFHAEDLNGKQDTLSYVFFIRKNYTSDDARQYLIESGHDSHIGQTIQQNEMSYTTKNMIYAFSTFEGETPDGMATSHQKEVPEISIYKDSDGIWYTDYTARWAHSVDSEWRRNGKRHQVDLNTSYEFQVKDPVAFWLVSIDEDGTHNYLEEVPFSLEETEDHITVRMHNFDISQYDDNVPLYIVMKVKSKKNHISYDFTTEPTGSAGPLTMTAVVFPEDYDPTKHDTRFTYKKGNNTTHTAFDNDDNVYGNTEGKVPVDDHFQLLTFRVRDYQPYDTEQTITQKLENPGGHLVQNPFPALYSSSQTVYEGVPVRPSLGNSNLKIDIPYVHSGNPNQKRVDYIGLNVLGSRVSLLLDYDGSYSDLDLKIRQAYYSNGSDNHNLSVVPIPSTDDEGVVRYLGYLLIDVPISTGDIVEISTYYEDGSMARNTVVIPETFTGALPRKYYTLQPSGTSTYMRDTGNGTVLFDQEVQESGADNWLIENDGLAYIIMNKETDKVLGIVDGEVGTYDWEPGNDSFYWYLAFEDDNTILVVNYNQIAFLKTWQEGDTVEPIFSYSDGTSFAIDEAGEAPPIITHEPRALLSKNTHTTLDMGSTGGVTMINNAHLLPEEGEDKLSIEFIYSGALHYKIKKGDKYLYYNPSNTVEWRTNEPTDWLLDVDRSDTGFFTVSIQQGALFSTPETPIAIDGGLDLELTDDKYQFTLFTEFGGPIAHFHLDNNADDGTEYKRHGTSYGVVYVEDDDRGTVASFDGVDDYIDTNFDFSPNDYEGDMTVSFWMKTDDWGSHFAARVIESNAWAIMRDGTLHNNRFYVYRSYNGIKINSFHTGDVDHNDNQWRHVSLVFDTQEDGKIYKRSYIEGALIDENSMSQYNGFYSGEGNTTLIAKEALEDIVAYYRGRLDDIKIWGRPLSNTEIYSEFQRTDEFTPMGYDNYIVANHSSDGVLEVNTETHDIRDDHYVDDWNHSDEWLLDPWEEGEERYYYIRNRRSMRLLDVNDSSTEDGASVITDYLTKNNSQQWKMEPATADGFQIENVNSGLCIERNSDGTYVQRVCKISEDNGFSNQVFSFLATGGAVPVVEDAMYYISNNQSLLSVEDYDDYVMYMSSYFPNMYGYENYTETSDDGSNLNIIFVTRYQAAGLYRIFELAEGNNYQTLLSTSTDFYDWSNWETPQEITGDVISPDFNRYYVIGEDAAVTPGEVTFDAQAYHEQLWSFEKKFGVNAVNSNSDEDNDNSLDLFDIASAKHIDYGLKVEHTDGAGIYFPSGAPTPGNPADDSQLLYMVTVDDTHTRQYDWQLTPGLPVEIGDITSSKEENEQKVNKNQTLHGQPSVLYPNKSDGRFNLLFSLEHAAEVSYQIFNMAGKVVQEDRKYFEKGIDHIWEVNTRQLSNGMYFTIVVASGEWKKTHKVLIQ